MSITENAIELIGIVNEICEEKNLDIKEIIEKKDYEFYEIWKEAGRRFDDIKQYIENDCSCKRCKKHEANIKEIELLYNLKKKHWDGKTTLIQNGIIIGMDMALTMLR
ncbi:hypothetical protein [Paraclostridium sordellii]|uniref:hypothetical protein n=1 Tax=Paraclostridium sordellii TaxID=1505 RepID=UPI0022E87701|nr:hypothetical protein [Paeniclostridium sordellii]